MILVILGLWQCGGGGSDGGGDAVQWRWRSVAGVVELILVAVTLAEMERVIMVILAVVQVTAVSTVID